MKIIQNTVYSSMFQIEFSDGELSDIYNITWAKEHMRVLEKKIGVEHRS